MRRVWDDYIWPWADFVLFFAGWYVVHLKTSPAIDQVGAWAWLYLAAWSAWLLFGVAREIRRRWLALGDDELS